MIPNLLGLIAMFLVSRHSDRALERRYHMATSGALGWDWLCCCLESLLTLLLGCSFFRRGHRSIQFLARFLFGARRIPDWLLGSCWYCAGDIRCQPGRVCWALHGRSDSAEDWQLVFRLDLRGDFFLFSASLALVLPKRTLPLPINLQRSRRNLRDRDLIHGLATPGSHQCEPGYNGV